MRDGCYARRDEVIENGGEHDTDGIAGVHFAQTGPIVWHIVSKDEVSMRCVAGGNGGHKARHPTQGSVVGKDGQMQGDVNE